MRAFERDGAWIVSTLDRMESELLGTLTEQFQELLGGEEPEPDSLFDWLDASAGRAAELDHTDPLIARLFPDAYDADAAASTEFRRFTEDDSRRARIAEARQVRDDLAAGTAPLRIPEQHTRAWLRTLNSLRIGLSVRLEVVDEASLDELEALDESDPRAFVYAWYNWLGGVLESLLEAL